MNKNNVIKHMAYRCPECLDATLGLLGDFALSSSGMLRLKCNCQKTNMDVCTTLDDKLKLSVPCVLCRDNHSYTVSRNVIFGRDSFALLCPYTNLEIGFFGNNSNVVDALNASGERLEKILSDYGVDTIPDLQPEDMADEEILPEPYVYDTLRLVLKDLEAEGKADCPCHSGCYDLRYTDSGLEAYCPTCGAIYEFDAHDAISVEKYITLDSIKLS